MRGLRLPIAVLFSVVLTTSPAPAVQIRPHHGVAIQAVYDPSGNPVLDANFTPNGALAKPRWSICAPPDTRVCRTVASSSQELIPGPTGAGTLFKATALYRGTTYSAISAVWQGQVHAVSRPALRGAVRVGAQVTPTIASWRGGWKAEASYHQQDGVASGGRAAATDQLSVEACRTRSGTRCLNLTPQSGASADSTGRAVRIAKRFKGWYLFAFDQHVAGDTAFATPGYSSPENAPTLHVGPTVARSRPYGPVR